jgi:hypothetical protein
MTTRRHPDAYPLNAPGDFVVCDGQCLTCMAPEHEAPDLMGFFKDPDGSNALSHCYFARQPSTPDEIHRALRAVIVACCGAVEYRGSDPRIRARLHELREEAERRAAERNRRN